MTFRRMHWARYNPALMYGWRDINGELNASQATLTRQAHHGYLPREASEPRSYLSYFLE